MLQIIPTSNLYNNKCISFCSKKSLNEQKKSWQSASSQWAKCKSDGGNVLQKAIITPAISEALGDINGLSILDAGCGEGFFSRLMQSKGAKVLGVDFSRNQIERAREIEAGRNSGIKFIAESVTNLSSVRSNSMDKVVSVMLTMYLDDQNFQTALEEFHRVLKQNGEMIILTRHPFTTREKNESIAETTHSFKSSYFSKKPFTNTLNLDGKKIDVQYYPRTLSELANSIIQSGFQIIKINEPQSGKKALIKYKASASLQYYAENPLAIVIKAIKTAKS